MGQRPQYNGTSGRPTYSSSGRPVYGESGVSCCCGGAPCAFCDGGIGPTSYGLTFASVNICPGYEPLPDLSVVAEGACGWSSPPERPAYAFADLFSASLGLNDTDFDGNVELSVAYSAVQDPFGAVVTYFAYVNEGTGLFDCSGSDTLSNQYTSSAGCGSLGQAGWGGTVTYVPNVPP